MSARPLAKPLRIYANAADQHKTLCEDCGHPWQRVFTDRWMHYCHSARIYLYSDGLMVAEHMDGLNPPKLQLVKPAASAA